jgi:16S rRNA (adenine1518-N6/adenine1519-N6)-dimethyltransferase
MSSKPVEIMWIFKRLKAKPHKKMGQNFFIAEKYIDLMVDSAGVAKSDLIIEIGPGTGKITEKLLGKEAKIIAIEKDRNLSAYLKEKYKNNSQITILEADFLKIDIEKLIKDSSYKIISNIPHNITGKIFRKILELKNKPNLAVFSLQKEKAEKITRKNNKEKENFLSLIFQIFGEMKFIEKIPSSAFWPKPKTDSAIVKATFLKEPKIKNHKNFIKLLKAGFSSPRKKAITNLSKGLNIKKDILLKIFGELGFDSNSRPEDLNFNDWKNIFQKVSPDK